MLGGGCRNPREQVQPIEKELKKRFNCEKRPKVKITLKKKSDSENYVILDVKM